MSDVIKHINLERLEYFAQQLYAKIDSEKADAADLAALLIQIGSEAVEANPEMGIEAVPATGIYKAIADGDINVIKIAKDYIDLAIAGLVNTAPETLDTLKELSDALGNDPEFATTVSNQIGALAAVIGSEEEGTGIFAKLEEIRAEIPEITTPEVDTSNLVTNDTFNEKMQEVQDALIGKADTGHNHDDVYATIEHTHEPMDMAYTNELYPEVKTVGDALDELLYYTPQVRSFIAKPAFGDYEVGSSVTNPTFTWEYNKNVKSQTLTGCNVTPEEREKTFVGVITSNKTFTVTGTDNKNNSCYRNGSYAFKHKRYYGAAEEPVSYDSAFILGLTNREFATSKVKSKFDLTTGVGQYIYYCFPASFGIPTFNVGGFDGGFELAATIEFTNASGHTAAYVIYKSENPNLGKQTISVS